MKINLDVSTPIRQSVDWRHVQILFLDIKFEILILDSFSHLLWTFWFKHFLQKLILQSQR